MRNQEANRKRAFQVPQSSQRLFDLIESKDEKFLNAFYFATKDTLVCDDIKIGTHVAFNSVQGRTFRVVTPGGEMIESSGVMSGGGKPKVGGMSNKPIN
jgi:structural maintenance of chromosome 4